MSWFDEQGAPSAENQRVPSPGGPTTAGGGFEPYSDAAFRALLESYPPTNEGIRAASEEARRRFGPAAPELLEHPQRLDKFRMPDGRTFDVVGGAGGPNPTHAWMLEGPGHGGGGAPGALGGMIAGGGAGNMGQFGPGSPFYDFPLAEGQKALERSAAAKGTLLTGGTAKALARYGQDYAYGRQGEHFNRLMGTAELGLRGATAASGAGTSYANQATETAGGFANNQTGLITGRGNAQAAGHVYSTNAWGQTIGNIAGILAGGLGGRQAAAPGGGLAPVQYGNPWDFYGQNPAR